MEFSFLWPMRKWIEECIHPKNYEKNKKSENIYTISRNFFLFSDFFCWLALQFLFSDRPDFVFHNKNPLNLSWREMVLVAAIGQSLRTFQKYYTLYRAIVACDKMRSKVTCINTASSDIVNCKKMISRSTCLWTRTVTSLY